MDLNERLLRDAGLETWPQNHAGQVFYEPQKPEQWTTRIRPFQVSQALDELVSALDVLEAEVADHDHDHGALTGLQDDDHPQYVSTAEAVALAIIFG